MVASHPLLASTLLRHHRRSLPLPPQLPLQLLRVLRSGTALRLWCHKQRR
jgi:hypothetical protein